jgi:ankyrin repeat protein
VLYKLGRREETVLVSIKTTDKKHLMADLTKTVLDAQTKVGWEDLRNEADASGSTPLHFAASVGVKGVTRLLVDGDTSGMWKKDGNGMCPIHIAASVGAMDAVHALVGEAALRDNDMGRTFLHVAVENKKTDVVKLVCRKSSPAFRNILNMKDKDGNTALHLAVQNRDESSFSHLVGNRYVELNHVNKDGYTPLDLASKIKIENSFASPKVYICMHPTSLISC